MTPDAYTLSARFRGEEGARFLTTEYTPPGTPRSNILFLPPFGEEMNRCRALVAEQARGFATAGHAVTLLDYFGTGDSQGELAEAGLEIWYGNIRSVIEDFCREPDTPVVLWGCRLGALLAMDYASRSEVKPADLILWQPVTSGKRYVTQVLRQRVAALAGRGLAPETTDEIRERLEAGELVEVSGYTVAAQLMRDIENVDLAFTASVCTGTVYWMEHVSEPGEPVGAGPGRVISRLEAAGSRVDLRPFNDPPLWQLHKRDTAPELLGITASLFA